MHIVNMLEAMSNLSRLVEAIEQGVEREIVIARNGRPAARLVAIETAPSSRRIGVAKGRFEVPDDIDTANPDIARLFVGGGGRILNLLLDTHVALWAITDHPRPSVTARQLIADGANRVWVSSVTLWEIAIKHALRSGDMPIRAADALAYFRQSGYRLLPVETLPDHHRDPFDRLLVAQAIAEPLRLLTHDALVASYSDTIVLV